MARKNNKNNVSIVTDNSANVEINVGRMSEEEIEQILNAPLESTNLTVSSGVEEITPSEVPLSYAAVRRLPDNTTVYACAVDPQTGEVWTMVRTASTAKPYYMIKDSVHGATINEGSDWKRFVGFAKKINSGKIDPRTGKTMSNSSNARIGDLDFYLTPVQGREKPRVNKTLHYMDPSDRAEYEAERNAARAAVAAAKEARKAEKAASKGDSAAQSE